MRIYELTPMRDSRKSFYGKAKVIEHDNGTIQLRSYDTVVCEIVGGVFRMLWDGRTQTTTRYINEFKYQFNIA